MPHDGDDDEVSLDPSAIAITFFLHIFHARIANTAKNSAEIKTREGRARDLSGVGAPRRLQNRP